MVDIKFQTILWKIFHKNSKKIFKKIVIIINISIEVVDSIKKTYDDLENKFIQFADLSDSWGFNINRVGSCSLTAI